MKALFLAALATVALAAVPTNAGVVIGAIGVTASAGLPSGYSAPTALGNIINQSGLSANYVSGVTDFATYTATTTACYGCTPGSDYFAELGGVAGMPATITFSFAGPVTLNSIAVWNQQGSASLRTFDLLNGTTLLGSFAMPTLIGQTLPAVFNFAPITLGNITMRITSNDGYANGTMMNEVAFNGSVAAVPEPATWALMIGGFGLTGAAMRRRSAKLAFA